MQTTGVRQSTRMYIQHGEYSQYSVITVNGLQPLKLYKNFKDILKSFVCMTLHVLNKVNNNPFPKSSQHCQPRNIEQWRAVCTEFGGQALTNDLFYFQLTHFTV